MGGPHLEGFQPDQQDQDLTLRPIPPVRQQRRRGDGHSDHIFLGAW
nr:MAG TPA: hypothetical protein [Caudoviricetes sp.]